MVSERINVRLHDTLYQRLQAEAARGGVTPSAIVQTALTAYLSQTAPEMCIPISTPGADADTPAQHCDGPAATGLPRMTMAQLLERIRTRMAAAQSPQE